MTENTDYLKKRIMELAMQADARHVYLTTRFLTPLEQSLVLSMKRDIPVPVRLVGGTGGFEQDAEDSSIRKIAVFGSEEDFGYSWENPVRIMHIKPKAEKFAETLSHRDYLGALMSLGIERELTGDIIVRGKEAWVFVFDSILDFLCGSLMQIRHTNVLCEEVRGEVEAPAPEFQVIQVNVASERLDLLLAGAAGLNREAAKKLLKEEKVFVNGLTVSSAGHKLRAGDEMVIRGYGKYIYDGISATSRKGRYNISFRKYI